MISIAGIIMVAFATVGLGVDIARHGQAKTGEYNGFTTFVAYILLMVLYYCAGVFSF